MLAMKLFKTFKIIKVIILLYRLLYLSIKPLTLSIIFKTTKFKTDLLFLMSNFNKTKL